MPSLAVFGVLVLLGSSIPFVPTGELVSGAAAVSTGGSQGSYLAAVVAIAWACSLAGDTALFLQARYGRRHVRRLLQNPRSGDRLQRLGATVEREYASAVIIGRLIPGGRAVVLIGLGASSLPLRKLMMADVAACLLWSLLYTATGAAASTVVDDPAWALVVAVVAALGIGVVGKRLRTSWRRSDRRRLLAPHGQQLGRGTCCGSLP